MADFPVLLKSINKIILSKIIVALFIAMKILMINDNYYLIFV